MSENKRETTSLREYTGTVTLVKTFTILASSDHEAENTVQTILDADVPEETGWYISGVSFQRKNIQVS